MSTSLSVSAILLDVFECTLTEIKIVVYIVHGNDSLVCLFFKQLFNTAITRAREWLIVLGHPVTLCTVGSNSLCWMELIRKCHMLGTFEYPCAAKFEEFLGTRLVSRCMNY